MLKTQVMHADAAYVSRRPTQEEEDWRDHFPGKAGTAFKSTDFSSIGSIANTLTLIS